MQSQILDVKPCNPVVKGKYGKINGKISSILIDFCKELLGYFSM